MAQLIAKYPTQGAVDGFPEPAVSAAWSARQTLFFVVIASTVAWTAIVFGLTAASQAVR